MKAFLEASELLMIRQLWAEKRQACYPTGPLSLPPALKPRHLVGLDACLLKTLLDLKRERTALPSSECLSLKVCKREVQKREVLP